MKRREKEPEFTTKEFLERLHQSDRGALNSLVDAYTDHLYRGALGLGFVADEAKELVQNVWLAFVEGVSKFEGRSHVRTFLFGMLFNKAREMRREHNHDATHDPIEEVLEQRFDSNGRWAAPPMNPEQFLNSAQTMVVIKECIDDLPLSQRMAFCLREIDEHGTEDVCEILKVSNTNLGVLIFRARNRLRECIERKSTGAK